MAKLTKRTVDAAKPQERDYFVWDNELPGFGLRSVLQDLLGHAHGSRITKQFYVHATEEAKRAAVLRLPLTEPNENDGAPILAKSGNRQ